MKVTRSIWLIVWCNRYIALSSHVVFELGVGTGRAAAVSARHSDVHLIMENYSKILLQSWISRELIENCFNVLGSGIGIVHKVGPFI